MRAVFRRKYRTVHQILRRVAALTCFVLVALVLYKAVFLIQAEPVSDSLRGVTGQYKASWMRWIWKQRYPIGFADLSGCESGASVGENGVSIEQSMEENGSKAQLMYQLSEWIWNRKPIYRFLASRPSPSLPVDPAYEGYAKQQIPQGEVVIYEGASSELADGMKETDALQTDALPGKIYRKEQLADYDFLMKEFYIVHSSTTASREMMNASTFLEKDFRLEPAAGGETNEQHNPQILIYHTHSQEEYANGTGSIIGVGDYLTELLQQKGYQVIHDTSIYDLKEGKLDRNNAYTYALEGITAILNQYPSIQVILDVHRDGVRQDLHMTSQVNGKETAPVMFFNGLSQTPDGSIEYLPNSYRDDNLAFSFQMQLKAASLYPSWTRKIYLKGLRYNLHLRARSALIEVGAQTNTYEEARNAMEPLAEVLDIVLQGR